MPKVYVEHNPPSEFRLRDDRQVAHQPPISSLESDRCGTIVPGPSSLTAGSFTEEFLLRCLSVGREPLAVGRESIDWHAVLALADKHRLTSLLYARLGQSHSQSWVPADGWERMRRTYTASAIRSMCFQREIRTVLRSLRSSGIPVIVLKGSFLAESVYGDGALRPMADVDLMVPRANLPEVQSILLDMGFGPRARDDIDLLCRWHMELAPFSRAGFTVESHWTIANPTSPFRIDVAGLWARARPVTIAGVSALALSPEDLLLHLCLHSAHEHSLGIGLQPVCDIAETVGHYESKLDWAQVTERAREWGASRYVGLALHLTQSMLEAAVPGAVLEQLVPDGIDRRVCKTVRQYAFGRAGYERSVPLFDRFGVPFFDRFGVQSFSERVRLSWRRVFLSREEMAAKYPASRDSRCVSLYYALRARDVIRTYGSYLVERGRLRRQLRGRDPHVVLRWLSGKD
ncbi:MAG TPA: nucleotidyltransferase family protein [bacterium]|nr:nucleotidyltransferase family protein [bacterium]